MNIFGIDITTKKDLKNIIAELEEEVMALDTEIDELETELDALEAKNEKLIEELSDLQDVFPFSLGQVVYDVALKDSKGRYTKTNPSIKHSTITAVTVDEKNYFSLVERLKRNDVFFDDATAYDFIQAICTPADD